MEVVKEAVVAVEAPAMVEAPEVVTPVVVRKKWAPKAGAANVPSAVEAEPVPPVAAVVEGPPSAPVVADTAPARKKWEPKKSAKPPDSEG